MNEQHLKEVLGMINRKMSKYYDIFVLGILTVEKICTVDIIINKIHKKDKTLVQLSKDFPKWWNYELVLKVSKSIKGFSNYHMFLFLLLFCEDHFHLWKGTEYFDILFKDVCSDTISVWSYFISNYFKLDYIQYWIPKVPGSGVLDVTVSCDELIFKIMDENLKFSNDMSYIEKVTNVLTEFCERIINVIHLSVFIKLLERHKISLEILLPLIKEANPDVYEFLMLINSSELERIQVEKFLKH